MSTYYPLAIAGLGQLGQLLAKRVEAQRLLLISTDRDKAARTAAAIPNADAGVPATFSLASVVLMALPAHRMEEYYHNYAAFFHPNAVLINCATMLPTDQLRRTCGGHRWFPLKVLGSVKELEHGGTVPLITDSEEAKALLEPYVAKLGEVVVGDEGWVVTCNRIAARCALEASLQIADEIRAHGLPDSFVHAAQTMVARGVIQSYADGTLGHFARGILEEVMKNRRAAKQADSNTRAEAGS
jgi:hypothetical protein